MHATLPRYLLTPPGFDSRPLLERIGGGLPIHEVTSVDDLVMAGSEDATHRPGWVFIAPETDPVTVAALLVRLASENGAWSPLLLIDDEQGLSVVPVSPGFHLGIGEVIQRLDAGDENAGLLSFRLGLEDLSRIRHDVNNSLAAAFAEVQLLIMDVDEGSELAESLHAAEVQLRRVRDLIAALAAFRIPRR